MTLFKLSASFALCLSLAFCQTPPPPQTLTVQGISATNVVLSVADVEKLPQHTIHVADHGTPATFQGVALSDILAKVTVPMGEKYHGTDTSYYMLVDARDGYRAVYAWAELDSSFMDKPIYLVTKRDGKPLSDKEGPFRLIAPGEKRPARWVRQVTALRIEPSPLTGAYDYAQAAWIVANLPALESIKPGMTRRDLLRVFMEEGGISTAARRRYVYRRCGLVKVEVEFALTGKDPLKESPEDRITKISKPFLEFGILD